MMELIALWAATTPSRPWVGVVACAMSIDPPSRPLGPLSCLILRLFGRLPCYDGASYEDRSPHTYAAIEGLPVSLSRHRGCGSSCGARRYRGDRSRRVAGRIRATRDRPVFRDPGRRDQEIGRASC